MEVVGRGGALAKNVRAGGRSSASITLVREEPRLQVLFAGFTSGEVVVDPVSKKVLVRASREAKPRSLITQDPDRHHAMLLILEGVTLAAREYAVEELGSLAPHPVPTLYDTTPHHPNGIVDVADVRDLEEGATDRLEGRLIFSGEMFLTYWREEHLRLIVPVWDQLAADRGRGREVQLQLHARRSVPP